MALNFQQQGSALMRRVLLIGLIVASVVMMTVYGREGETGPLHTLQSAVSGAVSPLRIVGGSIESATSTVGDTVDNITADQSTLSGLREYNEQLVRQYSQMEEYKQEAQRLQKLLDLKDTYQIEGTGARVIGRSSEAWSQTVIINKGSDDGVSTGQTVMGTSGVVGQIVSTSSHTATVRLLTDPQSGAAAMVQSSRAEGILRGSLVGLLYLEDLDADAEVNVGDVVVTSGLGGSYARGLIIGTVVKVDAQQGDTSRRAVVSPNDAISTLEDVLVVSSVGSDADDSDDSSTSSSSSSTASSSSSSSNSSTSANSNSGSSSNNGTASSNGSNNSNSSDGSTNANATSSEGGR
ncbi:rod shape-determining protein MreC [uncultured Senegalimassilia sp.]|uniref:rod shape-determining protein MreC n=1 Tax=uncultured Senegalimassilia sp. TaxID=1714350 RepID=UPI0026E10AA7|nr:rod shape-determining protein MreC [uncultured Senegalimassilia sp.]